MPSTGHVTRLFSTTAAALRARHPGAAAQKRNRRAAAARRLETERERERIRTVRRRVYVPSIGHLFPPFLYDRRRSEGLTARRRCAKTKPRDAARRFTAEERGRERERERADRETIRTMKRRVYVPSIGHVSLLFSTTAAAVSTAGGLDRERERELIEIERERETRVIAVDVVEFLHQLLRALLRDLFTQWVCVCV